MFLGSSFDDVILAANQVLINNIALDGFAFAAEDFFCVDQFITSQWGVVLVI